MNHPAAHTTEDLFAFPIETPNRSGAEASGLLYADDQDPKILTDAGVVSRLHSRFLERAFVGEAMARRAWATRRHMLVQEGADHRDASEAQAAHRGAAELLVMLASAMAVGFRGAPRLERVAARILLGRARARLGRCPSDREARAIAVATARELRRAAP